jgi:VIT1/CCC1 family predicted Fe2+/Mn2+ transporter
MGYSNMVFIFFNDLGAVSAKTRDAKIGITELRICFWGTFAIEITSLVGHLLVIIVS